jgi:hypothetical protein
MARDLARDPPPGPRRDGDAKEQVCLHGIGLVARQVPEPEIADELTPAA